MVSVNSTTWKRIRKDIRERVKTTHDAQHVSMLKTLNILLINFIPSSMLGKKKYIRAYSCINSIRTSSLTSKINR